MRCPCFRTFTLLSENFPAKGFKILPIKVFDCSCCRNTYTTPYSSLLEQEPILYVSVIYFHPVQLAVGVTKITLADSSQGRELEEARELYRREALQRKLLYNKV